MIRRTSMCNTITNFRNTIESISGSIFAIGAALCVSLGVILMGFLTEVSPIQIMFLISIFRALSCLQISLHEGYPLALRGENLLLTFGRGLSSNLSYFLLLFSVDVISMGEAVTFHMMSPILATILAFVFLKENCPKLSLLYLAMNMAGGLVIGIQARNHTNPGLKGNSASPTYIGHAGAFLSSVFSSIAALFARKLQGVPSMTVCLYSSALGVFLWALALTVRYKWYPYECGLYGTLIVFTGICSFGMDVFIILALKYKETNHVAMIYSTNIVWTYMLEIIAFHRYPSGEDIIGGLLVVSSAVSTVMCSFKKSGKWFGGMIAAKE